VSGSSVRGAAIWSLLGQYFSFAIQFGVSVVIARFFLTPEEVGLFSVALSAAMLISILQDFGITRYISGAQDLGEAELRTCFSVSILFALAIGLVILALAWPAAAFYDDARLTPLLATIAGSYLLVPLAIVPTALLQRRMDFRSLFFVNVGGMAVGGGVALATAAAGESSQSLAWGTLAQTAARALISTWRSGERLRWPPTLAGARPILRFGSGASLLALSGAAGVRSPELIIGRLISMEAVGLYSRASSLAAQLRYLVSGAVGGVFYPAFARLRDRGEDLAAPYVRVVAGLSGTTWPAMAFLAAAATPLVLILYGETWARVSPLLVWIALSEFAFTALPLHIDLPMLLGRMRRLLLLNILDTAVSLALLIVACFWSLEWAAASRVGYGIIWVGIYARFMRRLTGFRWRDMLLVYLQSLAATVATVAPLLLVYWYWAAPAELGFLPLAAAGAAGCLAWLGTIYLVRHPVRHEVTAVLEAARANLRPRLGFGR
jgi:O-antigen/teichoic acid export membrane protein